MGIFHHFRLLLVALVIGLSGGFSVFGQTGMLPHLSFSQKDYKDLKITVGPQNFGVTTDATGLIYVAHAGGILVYDGITWRGIPASDNGAFFKLVVGPDGRIYTGGREDFGFLCPDSTGALGLCSLKDRMPDSISAGIGRVTRVKRVGDEVFFLAGDQLIRHKEGEVSLIQSPETIIRIFPFGKDVLAYTRENHFFRVLPQSLEKLELAFPPEVRIRGVYQLGEEEFLFFSSSHGTFRFFEGRTQAYPLPPDSFRIYNVTDENSGEVGIGTYDHGLLLFKPGTGQVRVLGKAAGLVGNEVIFPSFTPSGNILAAQQSGFSILDVSSPFQFWTDESGLTGTVLSIRKAKEGLWFGTTNGLSFMRTGSSASIRESPVNTGEVWGIFPYGSGQIGVAGEKGIFEAQGEGKLRPLFLHEDAITSFCSGFGESSGLYFADANRRIYPLSCSAGSCTPGPELARLPHSVYDMIQGPDGRIWAAYNGLSFLELAEDGSARATTLDSSHGFSEAMGIIEVSLLKGEVAFGTELGIYRWNEKAQKLEPAPTFGEQFADGSSIAYNLTETRAGDIWVTTSRQTGILRLQENGRYVYDSLPLIAAPLTDVFSIYEDPDGIVWVGGPEALVRYDPKVKKDYRQPYHCLIRRVTLGNDSLIFDGHYADENGYPSLTQPDAFVPKLPYELNALNFSYAAPFFDRPDKLEYSHQLVGQDEAWTPWSKKYENSYTNLSEGAYNFRVKARNVYGTISHVAEYRFVILPPWYRSIWAYLFYAFLGILGVWGIVRLNTARLVRAKRRLEGIVDERTEEIRVEKEKSDALLLNILPEETAAELKAEGRAASRQFPEVSVMFTDFKGFTFVSEQLTPEELVDEIHHYFSEFDKIARKHRIEKIKTIGDAYMAAGGLPTPDGQHALHVVQTALEIRDWVEEEKARRQANNQLYFEVRIGVHSGPVVAGIVGLHKFQYDIWGDTVNTAARMESSGEPGKVNVSEATWELVKQEFAGEFRGEIEAKNKGLIRMYFVDWKKKD